MREASVEKEEAYHFALYFVASTNHFTQQTAAAGVVAERFDENSHRESLQF